MKSCHAQDQENPHYSAIATDLIILITPIIYKCQFIINTAMMVETEEV